jgi:trehalose 6-phosphate synthase
LQTRARNQKAKEWATRFLDNDQLLVVRSDRSEPSKNIVRGFQAFGRLLDRRSDLDGRVRFVACVYPSRQSLPEYRRYAEAIEAAAAEVNARHPESVELFMNDDFDRSLGALSVYDVLLVNPIMDGMNLVSKEGPAVNRKDGVLVLSSSAGSFEELGDEAVVIDDALDVEETATRIEEALELAAPERSRRAAVLKEKAGSKEPEGWIKPQLEDLRAIRAGQLPVSAPPVFG